ncbi:MAG: acetyl-CoA hydrolase/transferase family protein [Deltaproteobacteria bacterium]|nr:acetyl-CoA hydrolase/transferase family protein [Deltaproteobacteria bacterium]
MIESRPQRFEGWQKLYQEKLVSLEEAAGVIKSGDHIFIPNGYTGEMPFAIVARKDELRDVRVEICAPANDPGWLMGEMSESFDMVIRTYLHMARPGHDEGHVHFLPYTVGSYFKPYADNRPGAQSIDVLLMEVSPPDEKGFCTFGSVLWEKRRYAQAARTVIAEIDDYQIRSRGDTAIHISEIDYLVDISSPPITLDESEMVANLFPPEKQDTVRESVLSGNPRGLRRAFDGIMDLEPLDIEILLQIEDPDEETRAIAKHLKPLIRDGDTVQIGVGKPSKYMVELGVLDDRNDLAIFSEMACPGMGFLVKRGIATGRYAALHPGKAVFTGLIGFRRDEVLWANENPLIELHSADYVVNIANIAQNMNMVGINNILQVDLTGQLTCETQFGPRLINGTGGQIEFHIGSFSAPGGRAISLLKSTWNDGGISTIVPSLEKGSLVTIPRAFADYVVTEWGVAELAGKTHRERAEALIQIAHPDFRDTLTEAARDIY